MIHTRRVEYFFAILLSLTVHALVLYLAGVHTSNPEPDEAPRQEPQIVFLETPKPRPPAAPSSTNPKLPAPESANDTLHEDAPTIPAPTDRERAFMDAPAAPTAQEWAQASTYQLKNSKRYRHTWGQQVRSMMGTAFEGPDQGVVRLRVEISPDGHLVRLETLWSTSHMAEQLARKAIENMPPLPPTPTGKPLVFEKTISFQPFAVDDTPTYKDDCLPDRPAFRNPYAWDGKAPPGPAVQPSSEKMDAQALEDCFKQLPQESVEAASAHDRRQLEQWRSDRLGR